MSVARLILTVCATFALGVCRVQAQEQPAAPTSLAVDSFKTVNKAFLDAVVAGINERSAASGEAAKNGNGKNVQAEKPFPGAAYSPRFLAIAEKNPDGPDAIDALRMTLRTSISDVPKRGTVLETRGKALKMLRAYYVTKPAIKGILRTLASDDDEDCRALVDLVIATNPDRGIKAAAYKELIAAREPVVRVAEILKDPKKLEAWVRAYGQDGVNDRITKAEKARIEMEEFRRALREEYSDLYTDLSIGNPAPEIKLQTVDGTEAKLSALKGKVVVLDIWATWCGPCKAMIPHERAMVARLKEKPFALVSISADEKKEMLTDFLAKEKMPWTHWWNGATGGIIESWDVRYYPTIYVIDAQGVIRHKNIRGDELEKAVNTLLEEAKSKTVSGA